MLRDPALFAQYVLQHHLVERQVGRQALQLGVFLAHLPQLARVIRLHAPVGLLPPVERLLGDPGQGNHPNVRCPPFLCQPPAKREPVEPRKYQVGDDDMWMTGLSVLQRLDTVSGSVQAVL